MGICHSFVSDVILRCFFTKSWYVIKKISILKCLKLIFHHAYTTYLHFTNFRGIPTNWNHRVAVFDTACVIAWALFGNVWILWHSMGQTFTWNIVPQLPQLRLEIHIIISHIINATHFNSVHCLIFHCFWLVNAQYSSLFTRACLLHDHHILSPHRPNIPCP
jgi:hypothetical protein